MAHDQVEVKTPPGTMIGKERDDLYFLEYGTVVIMKVLVHEGEGNQPWLMDRAHMQASDYRGSTGHDPRL